MLRLIVTARGKPAFPVEISKSRMTIGRSARNDIALEDAFASRVHAEIRCEGDACWLTDLNSANGTFLNGVKIAQSTQISPGQKIQIGETRIEVQVRTKLGATPRMAGQRLSTEVLASPENTIYPSTNAPASSGFLSVVDTVRKAASATDFAAELAHDKELLIVMSKVGIALLSQSSLDEVLNEIVSLVLEAIPAERAYLFLRGTGDEGLVCKVASYREGRAGREGGPSDRGQLVKISQSITEEVVNKGHSVLMSDVLSNQRFQEQNSIILSGIRSIMAVPISLNNQVIGMVYTDSRINAKSFTDEDVRLLTTIASVAAIKIENALLLEQRIENERIMQQLNSARDIQQRLLPVTAPPLENYEVTGISFPCYEVGGDYFDFVPLNDGSLGVTLGDVSGKGIDAAMLMSSLHACVRAQVLTRAPISKMISAVNQYLYENTPQNKFVTLFYGELDPQRHVLTYTNAGHNPPILIRLDGSVEKLEIGGIPAGISGNIVYEEGQVRIHPGDVLVIYSDGVTESTNPAGEEFGLIRLLDVVRHDRHSKASDLRDRIDEAIGEFSGKAHPPDDMTLVVLKRLE